MAWLKDFAKETPFGLAQVTQGFVKMKALGLDPTRAALTSFGNTASAMGKDLNQMIEAVADASTGEFERLKEFGIKAKKEGDNVSLTFQGVTTTIKNSAAEITQYLEDIGNTSFGGAMEERAKTLDGTIAALGDTWDELFRTVSTNNVGGLIFDSVTLANGVLEDATTIIRAMGGAVGETSREFGSLSAIQGGVATFFETVSVLAANTLYVLRQTGDTMAGVAAGYKAFFSFDFDAVRAIGAEMKANGEAARKEIDATTARILNARKAQEEYARYATRNASAATDPRRVDLGGSAPRATGGVSSGAAKAVKETISEYDKLIKKLSDELPKAAAEAEAAQMGYNKSQTEFLALAGSPAWASFSNSQRAVVASMFEGKIASEEAGEAAKSLSKSYAEAAAERIKTIQSMERAADSLQSQNDALREEIELIGLSTEQQTLVLQQRNDVIILTKEATLAELERQSAITGTQTRVEIALASEIDALKERNALLGAKGVKNAAVDAAKTAEDEWRKTADSINSTLTDALMRGFESGKDFAKNLGDTVVNMFNTMVLRPVISVIVNPVAGAVTGMMGLSGAANAAAAPSGVDVVGATSNGMSMLNTGINSAVQGTFSKFALSETGKSLGLSMAGPDASGYNMLSGTGQQMSQALGVVGDTLAGYAMGSMARSLISNGYSVGKGMDNFQRAGIAVGSALGGPVAGAIIGAGAGVFNQLFGRKLKDSGIQGTFGGTEGFDGERYDFYKGGVFRSDKTKTSPLDQGTTDALTQQFRAIQLSTGLMAETLGLASGSVASFTKDIKLSFKGLTEEQIQEKMAAEFTAIADEMAGQVLGLQTVTETIRTGFFGNKSVTRVTQVQSEYAKANETASQTLTRLATSLTTVNSAFDLLGVAMLDASLASGDMASRLIEQSGGGEAFAANLGTYYENFYDQAEKTAYVTEQVTATLASVGLQMPKTREEFRALVESQIALGDSGTQAVAALLGVSGAFASVTASAADVAEAARQLAEEQARAAKAAQDAAYSDFRRAVDRDRSVLQDQAAMLTDTIGSIADAVSMLKSNARELYGTVDSTSQMLAAQGMVYIENALAGVRAGGSVADYTGLSDAIGAARGGIDSGTYATQFERERDSLVLAGQLNTLADLGDTQLTFEERQLNALKEQLDYLDRLDKLAEAQVNGTEALTETVQTYFDQLLLLFAPSTQTGSGKSSASSGGGPSFGVGSGSGSDGGSGLPDFGTGAYEGWLAYMGMYAGWTAEEVDRLKVEPPDRLVDGEPVWDEPRKFALGGTFTNGIVSRPTNFNIGQMGEAGSEGILPLANVGGRLGVYAMNAGGGNAELIAEIRALRAEVAALRAPAEATAANTQPLPQLGRQFDTVSNGGTVLRNKALA